MRRADIRPMGMGIMMGAMALWMLHGYLTGTGGGLPGVTFVLAHVAGVAIAVIGVGLGLHRRWSALARVLSHRPSMRHLGLMPGVAIGTAGLVHLVHGAPTWI